MSVPLYMLMLGTVLLLFKIRQYFALPSLILTIQTLWTIVRVDSQWFHSGYYQMDRELVGLTTESEIWNECLDYRRSC